MEEDDSVEKESSEESGDSTDSHECYSLDLGDEPTGKNSSSYSEKEGEHGEGDLGTLFVAVEGFHGTDG